MRKQTGSTVEESWSAQRRHCMFEGFTEFDLEVAETTIHGCRGGSGPPLLLLHGITETHVMWHRAAPRLAQDLTVVVTDLRGYGDSGKPATTADHAPYAKRALARDQVEVMAALGFEAFAVCGHYRGARLHLQTRPRRPAGGNLTRRPRHSADRRCVQPRRQELCTRLLTVVIPHRTLRTCQSASSPATRTHCSITRWKRGPRSPTPSQPRCGRTPPAPCATRRPYTLSVRSIGLPPPSAANTTDADRGRRKISCPILALWPTTASWPTGTIL